MGTIEKEKYSNNLIQQIIENCYHKDSLDILGNHSYWKIVLRHRDWSDLQQLTLFKCLLIDEDIGYLIKFKWNNLKYLNLNSNHIGPKGVQVLVTNQWGELSRLQLNFNYIGDRGFQALIRKQFDSLKNLSIAHNEINFSQCSCKEVLNSPLITLISLNLNSNYVRISCVKVLIKANFPNLQSFSLNKSRIGEEGAKHLSKSNWIILKELNLHLSTTNRFYEHSHYSNWAFLKSLYYSQKSSISVLYVSINLWRNNIQTQLKTFSINFQTSLKSALNIS